MRFRATTWGGALAMTIVLVGLTATAARAQPREAPFEQVVFDGFSLGAGARPWGMGGAHLAIHGDPEAGSWNPAALADLDRPWVTVSFLGDRLDGSPRTIQIDRTSGATGTVGILRESLVTAAGGGFDDLAAAVPFRLGRLRAVAQVGYQRRVRFGYDFAYASAFDYLEPDVYHHDYRYDAAASGGLDTVAVRLAAAPTRWLRVGAGLHRWFGGYMLPVRETSVRSFYITEALRAGWTESLDDDLRFEVSGWSWDLGAQADVTDWLVAAVVVRPGFDTGVEYSNTAASVDERLGERFTGATHAGRGRLELPDAVAVGAAAALGDRLVLALDVTTTLWSEASLD